MSLKSGAVGTIVLIAISACGGGPGPVAPEDVVRTLTQEFHTKSIVFRFSAGDAVEANRQQAFHDWVTGQLGIGLPSKLTYYKYNGRTQMQALTGRATNGFAEPSAYAVHSIFPYDGHEAVHVYSALVGRPSNFFNEGIAVALNVDPAASRWAPPWNGTHVYAHTQLLVRTNQIKPLSSIITTSAFRELDTWVGYGEAGSFVLFLIEQHGIGRMLSFFRASSQNDSLARIEGNIQSNWGMSLVEVEAAWLAFINDWSG